MWSLQHAVDQMALVAELLTMVAAGRVQPAEPAVYPLDKVAVALDDLLARRVVGKVALIP
jgi:NADPH2:quinone reductase